MKLKESVFQIISVGYKKEQFMLLRIKDLVDRVEPLLLLEDYKDSDKLTLEF